ncbi:ABC transporter ATP-binding protein [Alcaligenaceae bacterium 429]|nr:ABC transporter ATP-binding protein [Alcaligenaceae bacterium 429]
MTTPIVELLQVSIGYGKHQKVGGGISLQVWPQEVLCLLGPNGSGKSTLFKTLLGLLPPLAGQVSVMGKPLCTWTRQALAKHIAYVPQAHAAVFAFSVLEVVLMGRTASLGLFASPSVQDKQLACQCLEQVGMLHLLDRPYTQISGGERQLVLIARALAQQPALLVMDEPTASLDFGNQLRVLSHIQALQQQGMGVLLCTHQPEHALQIADRIALFKHGRLLAVGAPEQTMTAAHLATLYDLDESTVRQHLPTVF